MAKKGKGRECWADICLSLTPLPSSLFWSLSLYMYTHLPQTHRQPDYLEMGCCRILELQNVWHRKRKKLTSGNSVIYTESVFSSFGGKMSI